MWVTGSVMWAVASGASLKFGVQGASASATNWFSRVNDAQDNGIRLYMECSRVGGVSEFLLPYVDAKCGCRA